MIKDWKIEQIIGLVQSKGINSHQIKRFVEKFSSYKHFVNSEKQLIAKLEQRDILFSKQKIDFDSVLEQIELCQRNDVRIITIWDKEYPLLLKEINAPPLVLYVKGDLGDNDFESISIVGTRACSSYGKLATEYFVKRFVEHGITITSGLARGIDTHAHLNTISFGGRTLTVVASGIDCINPIISKKNADRIVESGGAIISEFICGVKAMPAFFPQRNRIISGISRATLVIESAKKGGSIITAKMAFDQGREVFALPNNIFAEKSKGTNWLISTNIAAPAISSEFILSELGLNPPDIKFKFESEKMQKLDSDDKKILGIVNHEPMQIDKIAEISGLNMSTLLVKLLELEFDGIIRQLPGKYYIKI